MKDPASLIFECYVNIIAHVGRILVIVWVPIALTYSNPAIILHLFSDYLSQTRLPRGTLTHYRSNMEGIAAVQFEAVLPAASQEYALVSEDHTIRPLIKRLYVDENKPLKDVMAIMARDHNYRATLVTRKE